MEPKTLHVSVEEDHSLIFNEEEVSSLGVHDRDKIKKLIISHYENFVKLRHTRKTIIAYPSSAHKKYDIEVSYSSKLFDHDVLDILKEQVETLFDEKRIGMAKQLQIYIADRPNLLSNHLGKHVRLYETGKSYEVITQVSELTSHIPGTAVYKVGDELGLKDRFYVNNATGQYFELLVNGGGICQNRILVSVDSR